MKGMREEQEGKPSPMSDQECDQMMCALQEKQFLESVELNLAAANEFLKQNITKEGVRGARSSIAISNRAAGEWRRGPP